MMFYPYFLFAHITGVLLLFIANGLELLFAWRIRAASTTTQVAEWMVVHKLLGPALGLAALLILTSGLGMVTSVWGWQYAWIDLSLGLLVLLGILGTVLNGPTTRAIHTALEAAPAGELTAALKRATANRVLLVYAPVPGAISLGVVALMTLKPGWIEAGTIIALATIVGLAAGALLARTSKR